MRRPRDAGRRDCRAERRERVYLTLLAVEEVVRASDAQREQIVRRSILAAAPFHLEPFVRPSSCARSGTRDADAVEARNGRAERPPNR
jgi:hypothetical protein